MLGRPSEHELIVRDLPGMLSNLREDLRFAWRVGMAPVRTPLQMWLDELICHGEGVVPQEAPALRKD